VGSTLFKDSGTPVVRTLRLDGLAYIAAISYALYIFHPAVSWGWLGSGPPLVRYAKRIPEVAAIFFLAHLSTFHFEHFWISAGKRWSKRLVQRTPSTAAKV